MKCQRQVWRLHYFMQLGHTWPRLVSSRDRWQIDTAQEHKSYRGLPTNLRVRLSDCEKFMWWTREESFYSLSQHPYFTCRECGSEITGDEYAFGMENLLHWTSGKIKIKYLSLHKSNYQYLVYFFPEIKVYLF